MSAAPDDFRIVLDEGEPVMWAADREAWRRGMVREATFRAVALVRMLRRRQVGTYDPADVAESMLLRQIENLLCAATMLSNPEPHTADLEEELADDVLGLQRREGVLVGGGVIPRGLEGDPEARR